MSRLRTVGRSSSDIVLVSDAGPQGLGVAIYNHDESVPAVLVPGLQCAREYCGLMLGLCLLKHVKEGLGIQFNTFHWISDNESASIWYRFYLIMPIY